MESPPDLATERLVLRPVTEAHVAALHAIFQEPRVVHFWGPRDEAGTRDTLFGDPDGQTWTIFEGDAIVGAIQAHEETDPELRHAGIDIFLRASAQGRRLGPEAIQRLVRHLFEDRGHHRVVIDPAVDNVPAIRAYERAGFRRIGVMRRYEQRRGAWRDGLLLELVAPDPGPAPGGPIEARGAVGLRTATLTDVPRILPMMRDFNRFENIPIDEATLVPALEKLVGSPDLGVVWLVERAGAAIGYAIVTFGFDLEWAGRDAFLTELWIEEAARGGGTGREALAAVETETAALGAAALHLMVRHENLPARALYERAGFRAPPRELLTKRLGR